MAPRISRDTSGRGRGGGRGGIQQQASDRGGSSANGASLRLPTQGSHIATVGVKRPSFGTVGKVVKVKVNAFEATVPQTIIRHYDVIFYLLHEFSLSQSVLISPSEQTLPQRMNMEIIHAMQTIVAPDVFTPLAVYDGRKNMFAARELPLGPTASAEFIVSLNGTSANPATGRPPKSYKVKIKKVNTLNPEVLQRFVQGDQSHDNDVLTAITALNVVIRMEPTMRHTFNIRSFFTDAGKLHLGCGLELWQGLFQSIRPGMGRMLINVDLSTGLMYRAGPLWELCLDVLKESIHERNIAKLQPKTSGQQFGLSDTDRRLLSKFVNGVKVTIQGQGDTPRLIKKLSEKGAKDSMFQLREGGTISVAEYIRKSRNVPLRYPNNFCVEIGQGLIPIELCTVTPGQIARKQIPSEKTQDVVKFSTKKPINRLSAIVDGVQNILSYGQSEYVRQFGVNVNPEALVIDARIISPPTMKYGRGGNQSTLQPRNGSWNMIGKQFISPMTIKQSFVVVLEQRNRFTENHARNMLKGLFNACKLAGMKVNNEEPGVHYVNGQARIVDVLKDIGRRTIAELQAKGIKDTINLVIVILPEGGHDDIYSGVKFFGDVSVGVATQCMRALKCLSAKDQYFANVALKINVKLGGVNTVPEASSINDLFDPRNPTIVMGADVIHPAPGAEGRPSYTAVVGSIDSKVAKYAAVSNVQTSRQELISDLDKMCWSLINKYKEHKGDPPVKNARPARIIFFRDGVSEGQFKQVLESELPLIKKACADHNISPKITLIVVGKRHHIRFFPMSQNQGDSSGNCPAGTVVDTVVAHPMEFDFYLQSHGGLLGTSRSAHYSVLHDENKFTADALQSLSFALCHVYARSTRSVSIPAPVYYADIVCSRARNHYDPDSTLFSSESGTSDGSNDQPALEAYKRNFRGIHKSLESSMYFS
ncbi:hypothetical protein D9758_010939 [Tetrapyrgos nigripes]|uniref:Uncharacterized protein n=1 Tax=Tetrapyrgos nigripes TaxID=182062 RepID=A0A8H5FT94_9AGAR|nr:hypothetical protein D9758_010939 [Tetrapyrgos nigripes]